LKDLKIERTDVAVIETRADRANLDAHRENVSRHHHHPFVNKSATLPLKNIKSRERSIRRQSTGEGCPSPEFHLEIRQNISQF
jgi:hypothetical protein